MEPITLNILLKFGPSLMIWTVKLLFVNFRKVRPKNWNAVLQAHLFIAICQESKNIAVRKKIYRRLKNDLFEFGTYSDSESQSVHRLFINQVISDPSAWEYYKDERGDLKPNSPTLKLLIENVVTASNINSAASLKALVRIHFEAYCSGLIQLSDAVFEKIIITEGFEHLNDSHKAQLFFTQANSYALGTDSKGSSECFIKAYLYEPKNPKYVNYASWSFYKKGEIDKSKELAIQLNNDLQYGDIITLINYREGKMSIEEAITNLKNRIEGLERFITRVQADVIKNGVHFISILGTGFRLKEFELTYNDMLCHQISLAWVKINLEVSNIFQPYYFSPIELKFSNPDQARVAIELMKGWLAGLENKQLARFVKLLEGVINVLKQHYELDLVEIEKCYRMALEGIYTDFFMIVLANICFQAKMYSKSKELLRKTKKRTVEYYILSIAIYSNDKNYEKVNSALIELLDESSDLDAIIEVILGNTIALSQVREDTQNLQAMIKERYLNSPYSAGVNVVLSNFDDLPLEDELLNVFRGTFKLYHDVNKPAFVGAIAESLMAKKEYRFSVEFLEGLNIECIKQNEILFMYYIDSKAQSNTNIDSVLELIYEHRSLHGENKKVRSTEIQVLFRFKEWTRLNHCIDEGILDSPEDINYFYYKLHVSNKLDANVDVEYVRKVFNLVYEIREKLPDEYIMELAKALSSVGNNQMSIELLFDLVSLKSNVLAKQLYNYIFLRDNKLFERNCLSVVVEGCYVEIVIQGQQSRQFKQIVKDTVGFQDYIGQSIGSSLRIKGSFDESFDITIVGVMNKYAYQAKWLLEETKDDPLNDLGLVSMNIGDSKGDELRDKIFSFLKSFEKQNEINYTEKYYKREIGMVELFSKQGNYEPVNAIKWLSNYSKGIIVLPEYLYNRQVNLQKPRILDLGVVILLALNNIKLNDGSEYIVAPSVKDILIDNLIELKKQRTDDALSVVFDKNKPVTVNYSKEQKEIDIQELQMIIQWIDENVVLKKTEKSLLIEESLKGNGSNIYSEYLVETTSFFLGSNDYVMVSDDLLVNRMINTKSGNIISSEILCKVIGVKEEDFKKLKLLGVGITIESIFAEIDLSASDRLLLDNYTLWNLSFELTGNINALITTFNLIEQIVVRYENQAFIESSIRSLIGNIGQIDLKVYNYCVGLVSELEIENGSYIDLLLKQLKGNVVD